MSRGRTNINDEEVYRGLGRPHHVVTWGHHLYGAATELRPDSGSDGGGSNGGGGGGEGESGGGGEKKTWFVAIGGLA